MDTVEALKSIGLNDKEARVYLALLQLGQSSAYVIAAKSGLKNPTTYVVLDELIKKGAVSKIPRLRKQQFKARLPEELFSTAKEKLENAQNVLPKLQAITKEGDDKVSAIYFRGIDGVKRALEYGLKDIKDELIYGFYAKSDSVAKEISDYFKEYNEKLKRYGIGVRGIAPAHSSLDVYRKEDKSFNREIIEVSTNQYTSDISVDISKSIVKIIDYKNLQGMVIENADVAKTMRQIFELAKKGAEKKNENREA